jgi:hypothetical protein
MSRKELAELIRLLEKLRHPPEQGGKGRGEVE